MFDTSKDDLELILQIANRAESMGNIMMFDKFSLAMDLSLAHEVFDLRLKELLDADNFNFSHDVVGIQNHIDRQENKFDDTFVPRFSSTQIERLALAHLRVTEKARQDKHGRK